MLIFVCISFIFVFSVSAINNTHIGCYPSSNKVIVGDTFNVTIWLNAGTTVDSWFIDVITFNETVIGMTKATSVTIGDSWNSSFFDNGTIDNTTGCIRGIQAFETTGSSDNTTLFIIEFIALKSGLCNIELVNAEVYSNGPNVLDKWYNTSILIEKKKSSSGGGGIFPVEEEEESELFQEILDYLLEKYRLILEDTFIINDTNGDGILDTFIDPNGVLKFIDSLEINGNLSFLISIYDDDIPEFFWDSLNYSITTINHTSGKIKDIIFDYINTTITIIIDVDKKESKWIYIETKDQYPKIDNLTIKTTEGKVISFDMIKRKNGNLYILDDPVTQYYLIYEGLIFEPNFYPIDGTIFNSTNFDINIIYYEPVVITSVKFNDIEITDQIESIDNQEFTININTNLSDGNYLFNISAIDFQGNSITSTATYTIFKEKPSMKKDESPIFPWFLIILLIIIVIIIIIAFLFKTGFLYLEFEN